MLRLFRYDIMNSITRPGSGLKIAALILGFSTAAVAGDFPVFPVCVGNGDVVNLTAIPDDKGMYVAWKDGRNGSNADVYGVRLESDGLLAVGWPANGLLLGSSTFSEAHPQIARSVDGARAYFVWSIVNNNIFGQSVSRGGLSEWPAGGVRLNDPYTAPITDASYVRVAPCDDGGLFAAWCWGTNSFAGLAKMRKEGTRDPSWTAPLDVSGNRLGTRSMALAPDGAGGVYLLRNARRPSAAGGTDVDLFVRHFSATGVPYPEPQEWGRTVGLTTGEQEDVQAISDGVGGVYVCWSDSRAGANEYDVYLTRLQSDGTPVAGWPSGGLRLTTQAGNQLRPRLAASTGGTVLVSWTTFTVGVPTHSIYVTRVNSTGTFAPGWSINGVLVTPQALQYATPPYSPPAMQAMGNGEAYFAWTTGTSASVVDVRATRMSSAGVLDPAGKGVADATGYQERDAVITKASETSVGVFWRDLRPGNGTADLYGSVVEILGNFMVAEAPDRNEAPRLSMRGIGSGELRFRLELPAGGATRIEVCDVAGRRVAGEDFGVLGAGRHEVTLASARRAAPGLYFARLFCNGASAFSRVIVSR